MNWILHTPGGLATRLSIGGAIFLSLATVDLRRNGRAATRWREYCFLLVCVGAAMMYGAANDQITCRISWEYFYYGKELSPVLGPETPPDPATLHWEAAKVGMKATWTAGLLLGVALLIANNPRRDRARVTYRKLFMYLPLVALIAAGCGVVGGVFGSKGWLNWASADFPELCQSNLFRPPHFLCAWGVHLGDYVGGVLGMVIAIILIVRRRRRASTLARVE